MNQNLIIYHGGCYGTFFEWLFNFLEGTTTTLPFNSNGNSHNFEGNLLFPPVKIFNHIKSNNKHQFSRCHPNIFEKVNENESVFRASYDKVIQEDLDFLKNHFDKILFLTYNKQSILWVENNILDKVLMTEDAYDDFYVRYGYSKEFVKDLMTADPIERFRHIIDKNVNSKLSKFTIENLLQWNKSGIYDFDIWELRELLSLQHFFGNYGQIAALEMATLNNANVKFVAIESLKDENTFINTIISSAEYFNLTVNELQIAQLKTVHTQWKQLQNQMNKDAICDKIVNSIIANDSYDWSTVSLSILDEAWIQKSLSDRKIQIKCYNLNIFPTNAKDFQPLLEMQ